MCVIVCNNVSFYVTSTCTCTLDTAKKGIIFDTIVFFADAFMYYYPKGVTPNRFSDQGVIIPVPGGKSDGAFLFNVPYSGQRLVLTMPSGKTVHDIGHLTVWCRRFSAFFNEPLQFPNSIVISGGSGGGGVTRNCIPLNEQLQLTWTLNTNTSQPTATFTLCGCLSTGQYMAFGLSGRPNSIDMVGGDVTVAWIDRGSQPHAEDYFLQRREQVHLCYHPVVQCVCP